MPENQMAYTHNFPSEKNLTVGGATLDEYLIANFGRFEEAFRVREAERKEQEKLLNKVEEKARQQKITFYLVRGRDYKGELVIEEVKLNNSK